MINNILISAAAEVDIGSVMNSSLTFSERISLGLQIMLLGMGIVFTILIIIMFVLQLFRIFFYDLPNKKKNIQNAAPTATEQTQISEEIAAVPVTESSDYGDEMETAAAISAAIAVYLDVPTTSFRVVSFKRINKNNQR